MRVRISVGPVEGILEGESVSSVGGGLGALVSIKVGTAVGEAVGGAPETGSFVGAIRVGGEVFVEVGAPVGILTASGTEGLVAGSLFSIEGLEVSCNELLVDNTVS